jgi:HD-GYP domain-containing protein (c-di-GMP phosphodiesterase class II)
MASESSNPHQEFITDLLLRLEQLNAIGVALSRERDSTHLMQMILESAMAITHADGGTLYRVSEDGKTLNFETLLTNSLNLRMGGNTGRDIVLPNLPMFDAQGKANSSLVATYVATHKETVNIADVYSATQFDFSGTRGFDERMAYRMQSFLTVPMLNHEGEVIGVLQLINAKSKEEGVVTSFSLADQSLAESLASQAAIALGHSKLIRQMEVLFESFINVINLTIEEKSPHTGEHCQRVPELTMMLAEAAHLATEGPLGSFSMNDRDRYELKIAGLLHDCGKVTTPVHVVDKESKLQTIYDRIGLIDTRFEVLRRDLEIKILREQLALQPVIDQQTEATLSQSRDELLVTMEMDQQFLRQANLGSESMSLVDIQRVRDISGKYRWQDAKGVERDFLTADEIENLTIRSGTLNANEREIINQHIVATIKMLEKLPWPRHLRNVPEFAGGHHERMDGKGYPRGLKGEQMSVQARVMAIADVFEALTARDRPYKPGMKLSQAMGIMHKFKRNGHIDPDLFDVFVSQGVYLSYAHAFLEPWQVDEVDVQTLQ